MFGRKIKAKYHRPGVSQEEISELKEAFDLFDNDKSGHIEIDELKRAMTSLGYDKKSQNRMVFQILENLDKNKDGQIDFDEFLDMMTARISDRDSREDIMKVFMLFDQDGTGRISLDDLKVSRFPFYILSLCVLFQAVAEELGEELADEELREMIERADTDGSGSNNSLSFRINYH